MRLLLSVALLVSLATPVLACESYEECMRGNPKVMTGFDEHGKPTYLYEPDNVRAIAFKLDEIAQELHDRNPNYGWECIDRASDGFCRKEVKSGSAAHKEFLSRHEVTQ